MNEDFYISLIYKKLTGEILSDEDRQLVKWLSESQANRITAEAIQLAWDETPSTTSLPEVDLDAAFSKLESKMEEGEVVEKGQGVVKQLESEQEVAITRNLFPLWGKIAAGLLILFVIGFFLRSQFQPKGEEIAWQTITSQDEQKVLTLPDSSVVFLNPNSTLSFVENFSGAERLVKLEGEAFFDVERDEAKPFKIDASEITVEVLGTSFGVSAYEGNNDYSVHVVEGKVAFSPKNATQTILLEKDEKAVLDTETYTARKIPTADPNELAWGTRTLVFNDVKLEEAFKVLEKFYEVDFEYSKSQLVNCRLSAVYPDKELKEILEGISAFTNLSFSESSPKIYQLKGGPCD